MRWFSVPVHFVAGAADVSVETKAQTTPTANIARLRISTPKDAPLDCGFGDNIQG